MEVVQGIVQNKIKLELVIAKRRSNGRRLRLWRRDQTCISVGYPASVRLVLAIRVRILWRADIGGIHGVPYVGDESMAVVVVENFVGSTWICLLDTEGDAGAQDERVRFAFGVSSRSMM